MKKYKIASVLMIIHGGIMEIGGCLSLIPIFLLGNSQFDMSEYFSFIVPYFQENMQLMIVIGGIWGAIRLVGAIGLLKNRMWGFVLSVINCVLTLALMMFMLPAGIIDGVLAGTALILMLLSYFGNKKIIE